MLVECASIFIAAFQGQRFDGMGSVDFGFKQFFGFFHAPFHSEYRPCGIADLSQVETDFVHRHLYGAGKIVDGKGWFAMESLLDDYALDLLFDVADFVLANLYR